MKIYIIPVSPRFQPNHQSFIWPPTNQLPGMDFGVEQNFLDWLIMHPSLLTDNPARADLIYLPIFWNRYFFEYLDADGGWGGGIEELSEEVDRVLSYNIPTFTIAEADIKWIMPQINWRDITVFCSSRRDENGSIDIPLLCAPHPIPEILPEKKYLASFMGNLRTDGIRIDMAEELKDRTDCKVENANVPEDEFAQIMLESYIALCPRGQGAQSYRMYEAMQLGVVPLYISDLDCRPFRKWLDWDSVSLYLKSPIGISDYLDSLVTPEKWQMGALAESMYRCYLAYGKWGMGVIKELELL